MRIIDAFLAFNEWDMITARMLEAREYADVEHLAFESCWTHQGDYKPYYISDGLVGAGPFYEKLTVWPDSANYARPDQYAIERAQRDSLYGIIKAVYHPDDDDLILVTDVDEIVRGEALIGRIADATKMVGPCALDLRMHRYSSKWVEPERWDHNAFAARWGDLGAVSFSDLRNRPVGQALPTIPDAGWHLSYWGGADRFRTKLETFLHDELKYLAPQAEEMIESGVNVHGSQMLPWDGSDMPKGIY